jgi:hypothetical protein
MQQEFFSVPHLVLIGAAILGTFLSWVREKYSGTTQGSPIDYLVTYPWHTVGMFGATLAACGVVITTGAIAGMSLPITFWLGFGTGYTLNHAINKGPGQ